MHGKADRALHESGWQLAASLVVFTDNDHRISKKRGGVEVVLLYKHLS